MTVRFNNLPYDLIDSHRDDCLSLYFPWLMPRSQWPVVGCRTADFRGSDLSLQTGNLQMHEPMTLWLSQMDHGPAFIVCLCNDDSDLFERVDASDPVA